MTADMYDYVIVGGGTSGLTVADRLTEDPNVKVLVIEAGGDHSADPLVATPGLVGGLYGNPKYDYNFHSVPQVSNRLHRHSPSLRNDPEMDDHGLTIVVKHCCSPTSTTA
jgi:choline dehydrogenase-like flavoprotein